MAKDFYSGWGPVWAAVGILLLSVGGLRLTMRTADDASAIAGAIDTWGAFISALICFAIAMFIRRGS